MPVESNTANARKKIQYGKAYTQTNVYSTLLARLMFILHAKLLAILQIEKRWPLISKLRNRPETYLDP